MYKKCLLVLAAMLLAAAMIGCQCSGNVTTPSPSPVTTTMQPIASASPGLSSSPDLSASPDVSGSPGPDVSPDANGGAATIPDFTEGKEVKEDEVPEIVKAIKERFANGEIQSIKHAMQDDQQVYAVEVKTGSTTETVYVRPDGTLLENAGAGGSGNGNGNGGNGGNG